MAGLTINNPVTLRKALASTNVLPGDTLLLRGGTYSNDKWVMSISGDAGHYITVKPYRGERVIINGMFQIFGSYIRVVGLESAYLKWRDRKTETTGTVGFDCLGNYIDIVNCVIHDHDQGITTSKAYTGHNYYGNVIYYNGWDSNLGHGLYPQNNAGNLKIIKHNMIFDNFAAGIHAYGSGGAVSNFTIDGNTVFENGKPRGQNYQYGILNGGSIGLTSPIIRNNMTYSAAGVVGDYGGRIQIGYGTGNAALDVSVYDNYLVSCRFALDFLNATLTRMDGNTIIGWATADGSGFDFTAWPNNIDTTPWPAPITFPAAGNRVFLTANEYDAKRAQLTIYNWELADSVTVDVSTIYKAGDTLKARNVQDYWIDIQNLVVSEAGTIRVNMQNRTVASPVAWTPPPTTFPRFGAFILEAA